MIEKSVVCDEGEKEGRIQPMAQNTLTELREKFVSLDIKVQGIIKAMNSDKAEARVLALAIDVEESDDFSALQAINERFLARRDEANHLTSKKDAIKSEILAYYNKLNRVDWNLKLVPGKVFSGWGETFKDGLWAIIDTELSSADVAGLRAMYETNVQIKVQPCAGDYRLLVQYPAYRDTCWTDYSGKDIQAKLLPLLSSVSKLRHEALSALPVLE